MCSSMIDGLHRAAVYGRVELEVHRPHPVWSIGSGRVRRRGRAQPLTTPALRNPQALFPPEPLDLLVVDVPARAAGVPVGVAEPAPRPIREARSVGRRPGRPALSLAVRVAASRGGLLLRPDRLLRFRKGLVRLEAENPGLSCGGEIADYCLTLCSIRAPNLFQYDNHEQNC